MNRETGSVSFTLCLPGPDKKTENNKSRAKILRPKTPKVPKTKQFHKNAQELIADREEYLEMISAQPPRTYRPMIRPKQNE